MKEEGYKSKATRDCRKPDALKHVMTTEVRPTETTLQHLHSCSQPVVVERGGKLEKFRSVVSATVLLLTCLIVYGGVRQRTLVLEGDTTISAYKNAIRDQRPFVDMSGVGEAMWSPRQKQRQEVAGAASVRLRGFRLWTSPWTSLGGAKEAESRRVVAKRAMGLKMKMETSWCRCEAAR